MTGDRGSRGGLFDMIGIENDIEMPTVHRSRKRYPWHTMDVVKGDPPRGDSFLVPCDESTYRKVSNSLSSCGGDITRRYGKIFTMRRVEDGIRVWRIK